MKSKKCIETKVKPYYNTKQGSETNMKPERKITSIRLPHELNQQLKGLAASQNISKNAVMIHALQQYIERNDK